MSTRRRLLALLLIVGIPFTGGACEPIFPLVQLLAGSTLAGPMFITQSLIWLAVAVAIKCFAFVFLERRLPWRNAVLFMLVANVLSTIPGALIAVFVGASSVTFMIAIPIVLLLGMLIGKRLTLLAKPGQRPLISGGKAALAFFGVVMLSMVLFGLAGSTLEGRSYGGYWLFKFTFVTLVACTGMVISAVLEEYVIALFTRHSHANQSFYPSVFRANYITLGLVLLVAAAEMLPKRLNAPHFIVSWLQTLSSLLGLG